jgi:hypothetical protein
MPDKRWLLGIELEAQMVSNGLDPLGQSQAWRGVGRAHRRPLGSRARDACKDCHRQPHGDGYAIVPTVIGWLRKRFVLGRYRRKLGKALEQR